MVGPLVMQGAALDNFRHRCEASPLFQHYHLSFLHCYSACSPENFCGFSSNLPGDLALKTGGDFW